MFGHHNAQLTELAMKNLEEPFQGFNSVVLGFTRVQKRTIRQIN
jgi:hypothetical protein